MSRKETAAGWLIGFIIVGAVIGAGIYFNHKALTAERKAAAVAPTPNMVETPPEEQHPISEAVQGPAPASTAPLPPLDESDASVARALAGMAPGADLVNLLVSQALIPRIVATINAMPGHEVAQNLWPVHAPKGSFLVVQDNNSLSMDARNSDRYTPYMAVVDHANARQLVAWYVRNYPLFEQSYRDLGMPDGHFNDRLVFVIEQLLATPDITKPVALKPRKSMFVFADPALESLSAGQKMLLRTGPANEARIKAKLRQIHQLLLGQMPAAASTVGNN